MDIKELITKNSDKFRHEYKELIHNYKNESSPSLIRKITGITFESFSYDENSEAWVMKTRNQSVIILFPPSQDDQKNHDWHSRSVRLLENGLDLNQIFDLTFIRRQNVKLYFGNTRIIFALGLDPQISKKSSKKFCTIC
jgi:hypothetical protein